MQRKILRFVLPLACLAILGLVPVMMSSSGVDAQTDAAGTALPGTETAAAAAPLPANFRYDIAKIARLIGGQRYDVAAEFAERNGREIPVYFTLTLLAAGDFQTLVNEKPQGGLVKISFVTREDPPRLIENLHLIEATVAAAPEGERLQALGTFLVNEAFVKATEPFENAQQVALRRVQVGSFPAAELSGSYLDPTHGAMNIRLLAIPDPDSERAVIAISNGVGRLLPLSTPDDLQKTFAGMALMTFRFLPQPQ